MKKKSFQLKADKKKKRKNLFIMLAVFVTFTIGWTLFQADNILNTFVRHQQTSQFQKLTAKELEQNNHKNASFDHNAVQMITNQKIMESLLSSNEGKNENYVIAGLSIPSVGIRLDIYKGVSDYALLRGAGTYFPDRRWGKGNFVLAGHNMEDGETLFSPLYRIQKGQQIYVSDGEKIFVYKVTEKLTIPSTQVEVLEDTQNSIITLITCADRHAVNRICVRGNLVEQIAISKASTELKNHFM